MEGYKTVRAIDLHVGDIVIYERKHFDYKKGFPLESTFYRTIVGEHKTVSGMMFHLVNEPNLEFPQIAPWQGRWTYAENGEIWQMWSKGENAWQKSEQSSNDLTENMGM